MDKDHVLQLAKQMGLSHWDITYQEGIGIDGVGANFIVYNDMKCEIKVSINLSEEEKVISVIHELCHLINRDASDIASENLDPILEVYYKRFEERAIEHFARILYRCLGRGPGCWYVGKG